MDQKDLSIICQNAGTTAAVLYNHTIGNQGEWLPEAFDEIREHLYHGVLKLVAEGQVQAAFPGAEAVPEPGSGRVPQPQYAPPAQTPPVPQYAPPPVQIRDVGVPNCDKCGGGMWDNRTSKRNPKAPDFRCKNKDTCDGAKWLTPFPGR